MKKTATHIKNLSKIIKELQSLKQTLERENEYNKIHSKLSRVRKKIKKGAN